MKDIEQNKMLMGGSRGAFVRTSWYWRKMKYIKLHKWKYTIIIIIIESK